MLLLYEHLLIFYLTLSQSGQNKLNKLFSKIAINQNDELLYLDKSVSVFFWNSFGTSAQR